MKSKWQRLRQQHEHDTSSAALLLHDFSSSSRRSKLNLVVDNVSRSAGNTLRLCSPRVRRATEASEKRRSGFDAKAILSEDLYAKDDDNAEENAKDWIKECLDRVNRETGTEITNNFVHKRKEESKYNNNMAFPSSILPHRELINEESEAMKLLNEWHSIDREAENIHRKVAKKRESTKGNYEDNRPLTAKEFLQRSNTTPVVYTSKAADHFDVRSRMEMRQKKSIANREERRERALFKKTVEGSKRQRKMRSQREGKRSDKSSSRLKQKEAKENGTANEIGKSRNPLFVWKSTRFENKNKDKEKKHTQEKEVDEAERKERIQQLRVAKRRKERLERKRMQLKMLTFYAWAKTAKKRKKNRMQRFSMARKKIRKRRLQRFLYSWVKCVNIQRKRVQNAEMVHQWNIRRRYFTKWNSFVFTMKNSRETARLRSELRRRHRNERAADSYRAKRLLSKALSRWKFWTRSTIQDRIRVERIENRRRQMEKLLHRRELRLKEERESKENRNVKGRRMRSVETKLRETKLNESKRKEKNKITNVQRKHSITKRRPKFAKQVLEMERRRMERQERRRKLEDRYEERQRKYELEQKEAEEKYFAAEKAKKEAQIAERREAQIAENEKKRKRKERALLAREKWNAALSHRKRALLKFYGWKPWLRLMQIQELFRRKADSFRHYQLLENMIRFWRRETINRMERRRAKSDEFYRNRLVSSVFYEWNRQHNRYQRSLIRADRLCRHRSIRRHFMQWFLQMEQSKIKAYRIHMKKVEKAERLGKVVLKRRTWKRWQDARVHLAFDRRIDGNKILDWLAEARKMHK
eukprot:g4060.t1